MGVGSEREHARGKWERERTRENRRKRDVRRRWPGAGGSTTERESIERERATKKKERVTRVDLVAIGNGVFGEDVGS